MKLYYTCRFLTKVIKSYIWNFLLYQDFLLSTFLRLSNHNIDCAQKISESKEILVCEDMTLY